MVLIEEAYDRINCYAIGVWLDSFLRGIGAALPLAILQAHQMVSMQTSQGLIVTLTRLPGARSDPRDEFVLVAVDANATAPLPFGLDPIAETPLSAKAKLSRDAITASPGASAGGDRRVSYILGGARVLELRFNAGPGFDRMRIVRLGEPLDWGDPSNR